METTISNKCKDCRWLKIDSYNADYFVEFLTEFKKNQDNLTRRISND